MGAKLPPDLAARLAEAGADLSAPLDPASAWARLHERFGPRATLLDRYALEAAAREIDVDRLDATTRERLTAECVRAAFPGFEWVAGSSTSGVPIEVVPYDVGWPARFARIRENLAQALAAAAIRIDHVGSTSVPGLAAKPVIDVQVSVRDADDEGAYVAAVESVGVRLRSRDSLHRYFRPPGGSPRFAHVHVCSAGTAWERDHLLFRDFLRARADVASAYGQLKFDLAERYRDDRIAYTDAKTNFILDALDAARRWATETGWRVELAGA